MYLGIAPPVSGAYGEGRGRPTDSQSRSGWMVKVLGNGAIGGATTAGAPAAQEVTRPITPPSPAPASVSCLCLMRFRMSLGKKLGRLGVHLMSTKGASLANAALWALAPTVVPNELQIHLSSHPWGDGWISRIVSSFRFGKHGQREREVVVVPGGVSRRELRLSDHRYQHWSQSSWGYLCAAAHVMHWSSAGMPVPALSCALFAVRCELCWCDEACQSKPLSGDVARASVYRVLCLSGTCMIHKGVT